MSLRGSEATVGIRNTLCIRPGRTDCHDQSADWPHNDSAKVLFNDGQNIALLYNDVLIISKLYFCSCIF